MDQRTYDLAFVPLQRHPRTPPEIVFIIDEKHLPEASNRLQQIAERQKGYAKQYMRGHDASFTTPCSDPDGHKLFGYAACGYWTKEDAGIFFRLPLRPHPSTLFCSLTILTMTTAFGFPFAGTEGSNEQQAVSLMTVANHGEHCGHGVGGWLAEDIIRWLKRYAQENLSPSGAVENSAPMHPDVIRAQQMAAGAMLTHRKMGRHVVSTQGIYGWVRDSGAFALNCFGDACDLSVYPDAWLEEGCQFVELGCHNLDNAEQQLTLLAGLAMIAQLARTARL